MITTILTLDLGTTTGWALRSTDGVVVSGTKDFHPQRFEGGGMRFLRFKRWLSEIHTTAGEIGAVYFEEVRRHNGVDAAHVYGGLLATLTAWCEHHNIPYAGVPVGTIKKHATGKGNASKDLISGVRASPDPAQARFGRSVGQLRAAAGSKKPPGTLWRCAFALPGPVHTVWLLGGGNTQQVNIQAATSQKGI